MKCSIIIVSYNSRDPIYPCLTTIRRFPPRDPWEVVVVDNSSTDGTAEMVREKFPWVRLVANSTNLGYSKAVNQGIRLAQGDYFLILNPDIMVRSGSLQALLDFADQNQDGGLFGAKLLNPDGSVQHSCRRFYTFLVLLMRRTLLGKLFPNSRAVSRHLMSDFDHEESRPVDWILGACMLVRRQIVEQVGSMDERFFLYFEDVDWCYRIQRAGYKVYYVASAVMDHQHTRASAASPFSRPLWAHLMSLLRYYEKWNRMAYFFKRHRQVFQILVFLVLDLLAVNAAFLSAYHLRLRYDEYFPHGLYTLDLYRTFWIYLNLVTVVAFAWTAMYRIHRGQSIAEEWLRIVRGFVLVTILMMAATYVSHTRIYSRAVVALFLPLAILYDGFLRGLVRVIHRRFLTQKLDLKRTIVVARSEDAKQILAQLERARSLGLDLVGYVTPDPAAEGAAVGSLAQLEAVVEDYRVEEVIFAPGTAGQERIAEFVMNTRKRALDVMILTDFSDILVRRAVLRDLGGRPAVHIQREPLHASNRLWKRTVDVVAGTAFLLVSSIATMIYFPFAKVTGRFHAASVSRTGMGRRPFRLREFRAGPGGARLSDLLQPPLFASVLAGHMSLVGPFPISPEEAEATEGLLEIRFHLRPGVTGPWRLVPPEERIGLIRTHDLYYIQNWSLDLDLRIFAQTFGELLRGR